MLLESYQCAMRNQTEDVAPDPKHPAGSLNSLLGVLLTCSFLQCDKVAIVKDSSVVYFGPYDATAINTHMPVDHMLSDATVEAKESATAGAGDNKVSPSTT